MAPSTAVTFIIWAFVSVSLLCFACMMGRDVFLKWRQDHPQESLNSPGETLGGIFTRLGQNTSHLLCTPGRKINEWRRRSRITAKDVEKGKEPAPIPPQQLQPQSASTSDNPDRSPNPRSVVTDRSDMAGDSVVSPYAPVAQPTRALLGINGRSHPHGIFINPFSRGLSYGGANKNCSRSQKSGVVSTTVNNSGTKVAALPPCLPPREEWEELSLDM